MLHQPSPQRSVLVTFMAVFLIISDHGSSFSISQRRQLPQHSNAIATYVVSRQLQWLSPLTPSGTVHHELCAAKTTTSQPSAENLHLDEKQLDFTLGYINKHHKNVLIKFAETFSKIGAEKAKKNAWSGGSYKIISAKIVGIDTENFELEVQVQERGKKSEDYKVVTIELGKLLALLMMFGGTVYSR